MLSKLPGQLTSTSSAPPLKENPRLTHCLAGRLKLCGAIPTTPQLRPRPQLPPELPPEQPECVQVLCFQLVRRVEAHPHRHSDP